MRRALEELYPNFWDFLAYLRANGFSWIATFVLGIGFPFLMVGMLLQPAKTRNAIKTASDSKVEAERKKKIEEHENKLYPLW